MKFHNFVHTIKGKTSHGHTALHIASAAGQVKNVMMLVYEGKANVLAQSTAGMQNIKSNYFDPETPLHVAKTGKIIKILLSRTTPAKLMEADKITERSFFDQILRHQPSVLRTYLNLMVNSREDLENDDPHLIFDLSMFNYDTDDKSEENSSWCGRKKDKDQPTKITRKANQMDKHLKLMEEEHVQLLTHPVMKLFTLLKWHPNRLPYTINFLIFLAFLCFFSTHALITVNFLQCDKFFGSDSKLF